ncbi:MAG: ADOP family duplicated permease, partial [Gemmatimonadaceae bacterium]
YTLLDAVVISPLPYPHAEQLVSLASPMPKLHDTWGIARHQLFYYKKNAPSIEDMALYRSNNVTLMGDGSGHPSERVASASVSASVFNVLGTRPHLGRLLLPSDNLVRPEQVTVLGYDMWVSRFGADSSLIGRTIDVDGFPLQVVGVLQQGAHLPDQRVDLWLADYIDPAQAPMNNHVRSSIVRLAAGRTADDLRRELAPLVVRMEELFPQAYPNHWIRDSGFSTSVTPLQEEVVGATVTRALWILFGAVLILFLIAIANVGNLFLVRGESRQREVTLRAALGADRAHLAFHYLSDALLVSLIAGLVASVLVALGVRELAANAPAGLPRLGEVQATWASAALTIGVSLATGVVLALIPMFTMRADLTALRESGRRFTASRARLAARGALVIGQVALAVLLLDGAALMRQSFQRLRAVRLGFDPAAVTTMSLALPNATYRDFVSAATFQQQLASQLTQVSGITSVGFVTQLPLTGHSGCTGVHTDGRSAAGVREGCVSNMQVGPDYFATMRTALTGRAPTWRETLAGDGVVVTHALATVLWPGVNPIGQGIRCCRPGADYYTVVGVAEDVYDAGLDSPPMQAVYFPMVEKQGVPIEAYPNYTVLVVRAPALTSSAIVSQVQRIVGTIDPHVPLAEVRTMDDVVSHSMARRTFTLMLLAVAASAALLLSAVGLYGVISYIVMQRRNEIGIRIALGARTSSVAMMVAGQSGRLVVVGLVLGIGASLAGARVLGALLFGVSPTDPRALAMVAILLTGVAALASFAPTLRAAGVDPSEALRAE